MSYLAKIHQKNPFVIPFVLILVFALLELLGGIWTQSLALLSDAWHMLSDVFALGLAMLAAQTIEKARQDGRTTKLELFVSGLNACLMLIVIVWIVIEAVDRLQHPRLVASAYVMLIALIGLMINLIVVKLLHQHKGEKGLNHQAALLHVIGDVLGSIAALFAGVVIYLTGWLPIDALLSILIAVLLLIGTVNLIRKIWLTVLDKAANVNQDPWHHH